MCEHQAYGSAGVLFRRIIRDELIPEVENKNRTNGKRILCGQSLSAVFTLFTLLTQPQLFDSYIANSVGWYADMDFFFTIGGQSI